jgi:hypothetical protein
MVMAAAAAAKSRPDTAAENEKILDRLYTLTTV